MVRDPFVDRVIANKFELRALLGTGAMGKVYRAQHLDLDRPVALKLLVALDAPGQPHAKRFKVEAQAASRLDHPNSVQILDFGEDPEAGLLYLAMEYLEGKNLQTILRSSGPLDPGRITWIMMQVFSALAAAHAHGVIHRDIKPGNIMLVNKTNEDGVISDFVKVCDFGLAKITDSPNAAGGPLTAKGAIFGTPAYMSPEQARGERLDARSDIYSCGVVMYKMISGHAPFRASSPTDLLLKHIRSAPPPLESWGIELDDRLVSIVERCMAKQPEERFATAKEARDVLRSILEQDGRELPALTGILSIPSLSSIERPPSSSLLEIEDASKSQDPEVDSILPTWHAPPPEPDPAPEPEPPSQTHRSGSITAATMTNHTSTLALIPGAVAIVGLIAIILYVLLLRPTEPRDPETASRVTSRFEPPAVPPKPPTPKPPPPLPLEPAPPPPVKKRAEAPKPRSRIKSRRSKPRTRTSARSTPSTDPRPPAETQTPNPPKSPTQESPPPPPERPAPPPKVVESPPPDPIPPPPPSLPSNFGVSVQLENVVVDGGISNRRCQDGLQRAMSGMKDCLRAMVSAQNTPGRGRVPIRADIQNRGRLRDINVDAPSATRACLRNALSSVRLPRPDTGRGRVSFDLAYRTTASQGN